MRLSAMEGVSGRRSALTFHGEARGHGLGVLWSWRGIGDDRRTQRGTRQGRQGCGRTNRVKDEYSSRDLGRLTQRSARRETRVPPISLPSPGPEPRGERSLVLGRESVARLNAARCEHEAQASRRVRRSMQIERLRSGAHEAQGARKREQVRSADVGRNASTGRDAREREQRPRTRAA